MRRRVHDEAKESFRLRDHPAEASPIYDALVEWCMRNRETISTLRPELPTGIEDRTADIWEPLLTIADVAGGDWPKRAREAATYLTGVAKDDAISGDIELFAPSSKPSSGREDLDRHLAPAPARAGGITLARHQGQATDRPGLADRLRPYRIKSRQVKIDGMNRQGFHRADFIDAWKRYLDPAARSPYSPYSPYQFDE